MVEQLEGQQLIVGDQLSAADIIVGSVAGFARRNELLTGFPEFNGYVDAREARPGFQPANPPA